MFCRKCGTKNPDDARFCRNCGTPMSSGPSVNGGGSVNGGQNGNPTPPPMGQPGAMPRKPKGKRNGAMIAIVAVVVVALVASAVFFTRVIGIGGRSYEDTIEDMVDAMNDADIEEFFDLIPKEVVIYALEQEGYTGSKKELLEQAHELLQNEWNDSLGSNLISAAVDVDYEIQDAQDVKGDELKSLKEEYKEAGVRVSAAKNVSVKFTITALGFSQDTVENIPLIKIRGSWYLDVESLGML